MYGRKRRQSERQPGERGGHLRPPAGGARHKLANAEGPQELRVDLERALAAGHHSALEPVSVSQSAPPSVTCSVPASFATVSACSVWRQVSTAALVDSADQVCRPPSPVGSGAVNTP
jgi:hypothetical protein